MPSPSKNNTSLALIKLNGTAVREDGTLVPSNYFSFLDLNPDDYSDISFTPEEARKINTHLQHLSTGSTAAIPLYCGGAAKCPFSRSCPFILMDQQRRKEYELQKEKDKNQEFPELIEIQPPKPVTPVGRRCLVEIQLLNEWTKLYIQEYEINPHNFTEFQMVRELAEIELLLWRLNNNISKPENAELVQETVVGIDKQGNVLTRQEVSSVFEAKERLSNRKSKLVKLMVGDRQEKYKKEAATKAISDTDPSISAAKLRGEVERLLLKAKKLDKVIASKAPAIEITEVSNIEVDQPPEDSTLTPEDIISGVNK
jgi:hypothetical protein